MGLICRDEKCAIKEDKTYIDDNIIKQIANIINNIKSKYILKEILSLLQEKKKNLIIYNKILQKNLNIDIEKYKKMSGKFKVVNENGYSYGKNIYYFKINKY